MTKGRYYYHRVACQNRPSVTLRVPSRAGTTIRRAPAMLRVHLMHVHRTSARGKPVCVFPVDGNTTLLEDGPQRARTQPSHRTERCRETVTVICAKLARTTSSSHAAVSSFYVSHSTRRRKKKKNRSDFAPKSFTPNDRYRPRLHGRLARECPRGPHGRSRSTSSK